MKWHYSILAFVVVATTAACARTPTPDVKDLARKLKDHRWEVRASAVEDLGNSSSGKALDPLVTALNDDSKKVRAKVPKALAKLDNPKAIWPLITAAAKEGEREVLDAITGALVHLGSVRPKPGQSQYLQRRLMQPLPKLEPDDPRRLTSPLAVIAETTGISCGIKFSLFRRPAVARVDSISQDLLGVPAIQALCRLLKRMQPTKPVGIIFTPEIRIADMETIVSVHTSARRADRLARARDHHALASRGGRKTVERLKKKVSLRPFNTTMEKAMVTFQKLSGVRVQVDWQSLTALGVERTSEIALKIRSVSLGEALSCILASTGSGTLGHQFDLDYVIDKDGTIFITTTRKVETRLGLKNSDVAPNSGERDSPTQGRRGI